MRVDFDFAPAQAELQRAARRLLSNESPISVVRELEEDEQGFSAALWNRMVGLGWAGLALPTEFGGGGGGLLDLYALFEELGRFLVPSPLLEVTTSAMLIERWGTDEQRRRILPALAEGGVVITLGLTDAAGRVAPTCVLDRRNAEWVVTGEVQLVPYAASATWILCGAAQGERTTLVLVPLNAEGVSVTPVENIAGLPLSTVSIEGSAVKETDLVVAPQGDTPLRHAAIWGGLLQTSYIVGSASSVLAMTNQYAKDRFQFGEPIGKNQAVQYMVSDVLIDLHTTDRLGRQGAYRLASGLPHTREAEIAIAHGKAASAHLCRQAHEVHAGVGFMTEHPLTLFSRRAKFLENNLGDLRYHLEEVASAVCGAPAPALQA